MFKSTFKLLFLLGIISTNTVISHQIKAQIPVEPTDIAPLRDLVPPQQPQPLPEQPLKPTPAEELLPTPPPPVIVPTEIPEPQKTITVTKFEFTGNTVFSSSQLEAEVTQNLLAQPIPLSRLLQIANDVAKLYAEAGYTTSGAVISIPETTQQQGRGIVKVQIIEGELEQINVTPLDESERLNPNYISSRIAVAAGKPLNIIKLQEALQLLQLNPIIQTVSAELADGSRPGTSILNVQFATGDTFKLQALLDNNRTPSVGTFRRSVALSEANLLGLGDNIKLEYRNTDGSDDWETSYQIPFNPDNGTFKFRYRTISSKVIDPSFEQFDIKSDYQQYELRLRQPIFQTPRREISLGVTFDRQESNGSIRGQKFPLSAGADLQGRTRVSTLRLFQEWLERNEQEVIAARSSFNFGVDALGVTEAFDAAVNPNAPETQYFMWRGQVQYVRLFAPDMLLLARSDLQLSSHTLLPIERFVLGGFGTVRGYPQNFRLTDNGLIATVEARLPVFREPEENMVLQIIPFVDFGTGWNHSTPVLSPDTIASVGVGLFFQYGDIFNARLDWGIPLTEEVRRKGDSLQENGIYFSVVFTPF